MKLIKVKFNGETRKIRVSEGKVIESVKGVIGEFASMSSIDEDNDKIHWYVEKEASEAVFYRQYKRFRDYPDYPEYFDSFSDST